MIKVELSTNYTENGELLKGWLIDDKNALFVQENILYLLGVKPSNVEGIYIEEQRRVGLGKVKNNFPSTIKAAVETMQNISVFDWILYKFDRFEDMDFDLL